MKFYLLFLFLLLQILFFFLLDLFFLKNKLNEQIKNKDDTIKNINIKITELSQLNQKLNEE